MSQDSLRILRFINFITFAKARLPCNWKYLQVLRIRAQALLRGHYFAYYRGTVILRLDTIFLVIPTGLCLVYDVSDSKWFFLLLKSSTSKGIFLDSYFLLRNSSACGPFIEPKCLAWSIEWLSRVHFVSFLLSYHTDHENNLWECIKQHWNIYFQ